MSAAAGAPRVRRIRPDEAPALRAIRLRALVDTPLAFGSTHAREAAYPPERWEQWARESAAGPCQATFLAFGLVAASNRGAGAAGSSADPPDPPSPVGLAFCVIDADDSEHAHLYAMWVAPEARGSGAATALVDAVIAWTAAQGASALHTAVTIGNDPAARLYERAGFRDTGRRESLGHSGAEIALLERALDS